MAKEKFESRDILTLGLIAGIGVGGYFLWKYFKNKIPAADNPTGFIIVERYYQQDGKVVNFPIAGEEFNVVIVGMNGSRTENVDGYCKIINSDTEEIVFNETVSDLERREITTFIYTSIMPSTTLNLTVETGRIIDLAEVKDHSIPLEIIPTILPGISATIYTRNWGMVHPDSIRETIGWQADVPDHGIIEHTFYLISYYAPSALGGSEQEVLDNWYYVAATPVTTYSMSSITDITGNFASVPPFDTYSCVTMIAEGYTSGTGLWIEPIYDSKFDANIMTTEPRKIEGTITSVFGIPISFATVTFEGKSNTTGADGKYSISNPAEMSAPISCSAPGFVTQEKIITSPIYGTLIVDFEMISS